MNSKQLVAAAMNLGTPGTRVPVMCQLSLGHYFLYSGIDPVDIWLTSQGFADALLKMRADYNFDGILINLPGRDPKIKDHILKIERLPQETKIFWDNGCYTVIPYNDNPHYFQPDSTRYFPSFDDIEPDKLFYIEPWDITGISYPYRWGFNRAPLPAGQFPEYLGDTIKLVKDAAGAQFSVHSEVFSPWSQFLELLNYENALISILIDPDKVKQCLYGLTLGAVELAKQQAREGVDAVLISSAFAGAGFISRDHYAEFVLPFEKQLIETVTAETGLPVYTHTCGSIGDRLDLMLETGTKGIDTLDPPPLGTVELSEAKQLLNGKAFIKGNIDAVNTLLNGTEDDIIKDVTKRIEIGSINGGFILSTACSVAPQTPPEHIKLLSRLAKSGGSTPLP